MHGGHVWSRGMWAVRPGFPFKLSHWPVLAVCSSTVQQGLPGASPPAERLVQHLAWVFWAQKRDPRVNFQPLL